MKTHSTFFTGATGSFEQVTLKKWKRFRILSGKSIGNLTNISPIVLGHRLAMTRLGEIALAAGNTISLGFGEFKLKRNWWPMFMALNLKPAFDYTDPDAPVFHPEDLTVSRGRLGITPIEVTASATGSGAVDFNWSNTPTGYQSSSDRMRGIVYNRRSGLYFSPDEDLYRYAENAEYSSPPLDLQAADVLDVWTFFINPAESGQASSGNSYYTEVTVSA